MDAYAAPSRCQRRFAAVAFALVLPLSGLAMESVPPDALSVKVYPDRYVAAGKSFPNLAALEAWSKPTQLRVLWLESCGSASTAHLLAAVERLHRVYVGGVQIRTFAESERACLGAAEPASSGLDEPSQALLGLPYYPSDRSGRSAVP